MVKDFHLFVNRRPVNSVDKYFSRNLLHIEGEDWKRIRSIVSPAFTAGKLRRMYPLFKQATLKLENYLSKISQNPNNSIDMKEVISGFSIDVIASTCFGINTDSNGDRSKFNPFVFHGQNIICNISLLRMGMCLLLPKSILKMINVNHPFPTDSFDFLVNAVHTILKKSTKDDNLVTLMKEAKIADEELKDMKFDSLSATSDADESPKEFYDKKLGNQTKTLTDEEIIGQCLLFFVAGFETNASTLTNTIFMLAHNPSIQERLHREITDKLSGIEPENLEEYFGAINNLPYLDAVIKETLRMYPPVTKIERMLEVDGYNLGGIELKKGQLVEASVVSLHYDPESHPEPYVYNPDRFMPENKHNIVPYSFIPFGEGPRNCVGMRFGMIEVRACLASLAQKFRFEPNKKTPQKPVFPPGAIVMIPQGYQITVKARD